MAVPSFKLSSFDRRFRSSRTPPSASPVSNPVLFSSIAISSIPMAMNSSQTLGAPASAGTTEDAGIGNGSEEEIERLESDVSQMAEKILHYRATLPDQLKQALDLLKSAERFDFTGCPPGTSGESTQGAGEMSASVERDAEMSKKVQLLREKTAANASMVPILLKRMKDCISSIDNLSTQEHSTIRIHSSFNIKGSTS